MQNTPKVKFIQTTQSKYDALETKDEGTLYFIEDTLRVYKGNVLFSDGSLITVVEGKILIGGIEIPTKAYVDSLSTIVDQIDSKVGDLVE